MRSGDKTETDLLFAGASEGVGSLVESDLLNEAAKTTWERRLVSLVREKTQAEGREEGPVFLIVRVRTQLTTSHFAHMHPSMQSSPAYRNHWASTRRAAVWDHVRTAKKCWLVMFVSATLSLWSSLWNTWSHLNFDPSLPANLHLYGTKLELNIVDMLIQRKHIWAYLLFAGP